MNLTKIISKKLGDKFGPKILLISSVILFLMAFEMLKIMREDFKIFCSVVLFPVVPKGTVLIRMIPTADHTIDDVTQTMHAFDCLIPQFTKKAEVYA